MIVVDAGPLYAVFDRRDQHHFPSRELLETYSGVLMIPALVVAEVAYLVGDRLGPDFEVLLAENITTGAFVTEAVPPQDWRRITDLTRQYRDLPLGIVDASVIACAERLGVDTVATVDRKHFSVVRPSHVDAFTLVP